MRIRMLAYGERILWMAGLVCAGICLAVAVQASSAGRAAAEIEKPSTAARPAVAAGKIGVMGRIDIPELAVSAPILDDYDNGSLRRGVGHIPGTAMPGGLGTVGLAGHRDTYFRRLRGILPKMEIRLTDRSGTYHYLVDRTDIVRPEQVEVLKIAAVPELTLITCYPFDYVGAAPRRFIVHAHLLSASPDRIAALR